ncbi:MAG: hypothetical protein AAB400_01805 [Patescibacteria group bacterium]
MTGGGSIVPLWMPCLSFINTISFGIGLALYLVGFWGGVVSFFLSPSAFPGFCVSFCCGIACGVFTCYLTNYECSFHRHIPSA